MRYIIDRKTNEHERYDGQNYDATKYRIVEADSEGWIDHVGSECPLPDDVKFQARRRDGELAAEVTSWAQGHGNRTIAYYRPILEKVQEPEPIPAPQYDPRSVSFNLLDRLKAAHKAAQTIPDLEAELREVLAGMGYDLVARSAFVEPEPAVETPQDMTDWRNWREGDLVQYIGAPHAGFSLYCLYGVCELLSALCIYDDDGDDRPLESNAYRFRFHSRPAKGEK